LRPPRLNQEQFKDTDDPTFEANDQRMLQN